jgi:hypothetical protein
MYSLQVIDAVEGVRAFAPQIDMSKRDIVLANLVFVHQVISASESLLEVAIESSEGVLQQYFIDHLEEERQHQSWLADDLMEAGIDLTSMPLSQKAVEMAGSQYYLIKHVNAAALLGYMAVLEGFPLSLDTLSQLEAMHGKELFRTVRYHAEHDLEHRKELFAMIDKLDDPIILRNAIQTATYMNEFTRELSQE